MFIPMWLLVVLGLYMVWLMFRLKRWQRLFYLACAECDRIIAATGFEVR